MPEAFDLHIDLLANGRHRAIAKAYRRIQHSIENASTAANKIYKINAKLAYSQRWMNPIHRRPIRPSRI